MRRLLYAIVFMFITICNGYAQTAPFADDIRNFKKEDSLHHPLLGAILFVGSSSFTKWKDVQDYFPGYKIINRGFGGSSLPDLIHFANHVIFPYKPKQVVIYCGENDIAASDTVSAASVFDRFTALFVIIREKMRDENIVFISIKPSPSRASQRPRQAAANEMIKSFLAKQTNAYYVDVVNPMLNPDGRPKPSIFLSDSLHMNASGYAIWKKAILPYLKK